MTLIRHELVWDKAIFLQKLSHGFQSGTLGPPALAIIAPSLAYMERAYFNARSFGWSRRPIVELVIPSTLDGTLAPRGRHVASLFCQHVVPKLSDGSSWDDHRETVADLMIETVNDHAPNFR